MAYPGDPGLDPVVQQRILTAFGEAVRLYREGHAEECRTILRSIVEVDPTFAAAQRLSAAVASGKPVNLGELLGELAASSPVHADELLRRAKDALAARDFRGAVVLLQELLKELPGHAEGRALFARAQEGQRTKAVVEGHLAHVREALDGGLADAAKAFLEFARKADPDNPEILVLEERIARLGAAQEAQPDFDFEVVRTPAPVAAPPAQGSAAVEAVPAGPPPLAPAAPAPPAATPAAREPSQFAFDRAGPSAAMEFEPAGTEFDFAAHEAEPGKTPDDRVRALLDQGQEAFDHGDFPGAIDAWSRIYLIDAHHEEAARRIEQARRRREEVERQVEQLVFEARDALEMGDSGQAREICHEALRLQPQNLEAHDLLQRLETPAAPPPPPQAASHEEDLFRDDFVPARIASADRASAASAATTPMPTAERRHARGAPAAAANRAPIPLFVAIIGAALLVVVAAVLLLGRGIFGGGGGADSGLAEAERLAGEGRFQEAVTLLQSLEVEGEQANQVSQRLLEYQRKLRSDKAPATPTEATLARRALSEGSRVKALRLIREGLAKVPGDRELLTLQGEIASYSPVLSALTDAVAARNLDLVRQLSGSLMAARPDDAEAQRLWAAATFNQAVTLLRKYQVGAAYSLLSQLAERKSDPEVERLRELAASYRSRPIDPRYQIFIANVALRALE